MKKTKSEDGRGVTQPYVGKYVTRGLHLDVLGIVQPVAPGGD